MEFCLNRGLITESNKYQINISGIDLENQKTKLYNAVPAPVTATPAEKLQSVRDTASLLYNRMMENMGYGQERLKDIVEEEAEEGQQQEEKKGVDLTLHEHENAFKGVKNVL